MNNDELLRQAEKIKKAQRDGRLEDFIGSELSPLASERLKEILSDRQATEKLLSTPQAKELMQKLMNSK